MFGWLNRLACWWLKVDFNWWSTARSLADANGRSGLPRLLSPCQSSRVDFEECKKDFPDLATKIYEWDFDIFDLADRTSSPLFLVAMTLLESQGLLTGWKVDRRKVERFLLAAEAMYLQNPYHNNVHAADVTQAATVILVSSGAAQHCSKLDLFCLIISAAVHDLKHPGVNNQYLVATRHPSALVYNDKSVNENTHVSAALMLAEEADKNIFSGLAPEEQLAARRTIIDTIMSTDMTYHFDLLARYRAHVKKHPNPASWREHSLLLQMVLHLADLANPARPVPQSARWARLVTTEFLVQGELESAGGLPVTPMCDKSKLDLAAGQLSFIKLFLRPTLEACASFSPAFIDVAKGNLEKTEQYWRQNPARTLEEVTIPVAV